MQNINQNTISLQETDKTLRNTKDITSTIHSDVVHTDNSYWNGRGKDALGSSPLQMFESVSHITTPFEVTSSNQMDYISFENFKHISNAGSLESLESLKSLNGLEAQQSYLKPPLSPRLSSPVSHQNEINNTDTSPSRLTKKGTTEPNVNSLKSNKRSHSQLSSNSNSQTKSKKKIPISSSKTSVATPMVEIPLQKNYGSLEELLAEVHSTVSPEKPSGLYDASVKPPYSYASMIALSIMESGQGRLTLSQIYSWISTHFPFYKLGDSGWQNSIRHNLSLNESFIKGGKCADGKGHFWQIEPGQEYKVLKVQSKNGRNPSSTSTSNNSSSNKSTVDSGNKKKNIPSKNSLEKLKTNNAIETNMQQKNTTVQLLTPLSSFSSSSLPLNVQPTHTAHLIPETPTSGDSWEWGAANNNTGNDHHHFDAFDTPMELLAKNDNDKFALRSEKKYDFAGNLATPKDTQHNDELFLMDTNTQLSKDSFLRNSTKQFNLNTTNTQIQSHFQEPNNATKNMHYWNNTFGTLSEPLITHQRGFSCSFNSSFELPNERSPPANSIDQQIQNKETLEEFKIELNDHEAESENHFDFTKTPKPAGRKLQETLEPERNFMLKNKHDDEFPKSIITETPYRFTNFLSSTPKTLDCVLHQEAFSKQFPENSNSGIPAGQTPRWKTPAVIDDFLTSPVTFKSPKNQNGLLGQVSSALLMHGSPDEHLHPTAGLLLSPTGRMSHSQKSTSSAKHTLLTSPRFDLINKRSRVLGHGGLFGVDVYSVLQRALNSQKQKKLLPHPELKDKN